MKKGLKRTVVGVMSAAIIAGIVPVNALAVTNSDRRIHKFEGQNITISLSIQDNRASASTNSATATLVEAEITMCYTAGGKTYCDAYDKKTGINATTATAIASRYGAYSNYADSTHIANFYINGTPQEFKEYWSIK